MSRKALLVILGSLLLLMCASSSYGVKVWLTPREMEGTSEVIPLDQSGSLQVQPSGGSKGALYLLTYDTGAEASYLGGLAAGFHIGVWFQSPAACTLLEIHYDFANGGDVTYYVADPSDTIDFETMYYEYHGGPNPSGPDPRESYLHPEEPQGVVADGWDTLDVRADSLDVGTDIFYAAYIMNDGNSNPIIDAGVDPPYRTLMYRTPSGGPDFGWYTSWHHCYIRALVDLYENLPVQIASYDRLPDTYLTTGRLVTADMWDLAVPPESIGVAKAYLCWWVDPDTLPTDSAMMTLIGGDPTNGTWAAYLPPFSVGDQVSYSIHAWDHGLPVRFSESPAQTFSIRAGQPTAQLLVWNDDYYGAPFTHDPVASVVPDSLWDYWDGSYGLPDRSVIMFGYEAIFVVTWDGSGSSGFVADTALIAEYLDNGGKLFISSQDLMGGGFHYDWGHWTAPEGSFVKDYLHMLEGVDDAAADTISFYYGVPNDPISDPWVAWPITSFPYGWAGAGYNYGGTVVPDAQSVGIFYDMAGDPITGFRYPGTGVPQFVFLYWPFHGLVDSETGVEDTLGMNTLIKNILTWFEIDPGVEETPISDAPISTHRLAQNFPNPVRDVTSISYTVPRTSPVSLRLYDVTGRLVRSLVEGKGEAGNHTVRWDGRDDEGSAVAPGVYFYRMVAGDFASTRKMVVLR